MQQTKRIISISCLTLSLILLAACSSGNIKPVDTTSFEALSDLTQGNDPQKKKNKEINQYRVEALKDVAMSVGAQGALAKRSIEIDAMLTKQSRYLDQIFNFTPLMLPHNVVPPVLLEGDRTLNLADSTTIRLSDKTYTIAVQAHFSTVPPTWHDYLWMSFPKPEEPETGLLPKNDHEQEVWKKYIKLGWTQGAEQAENIFSDNVARLKRDYQGMVLYRKLVDQNIVSLPYVATTNLGVTGGDDHMSVNDQVLRITTLPTLNPNSQYWKPGISQQGKQQAPMQITPTAAPAPAPEPEPPPVNWKDIDIK